MAQAGAEPGREVVEPDLARFFLALGAVGDVTRAAKVAGVSAERAWGWCDQLPRPPWLTRRSEAANRLFDMACEALRQTGRVLGGETDGRGTSAVSLRELVMVAERFFAAALKLDREVGSDAERELEIDLGRWAEAQDSVGRPAAAPGAVDGAP
jgi:hypothetical protein